MLGIRHIGTSWPYITQNKIGFRAGAPYLKGTVTHWDPAWLSLQSSSVLARILLVSASEVLLELTKKRGMHWKVSSLNIEFILMD